MADEPRLQAGQQGEWVSYLQQTLTYQGISAGGANGTFDAQLETAVKQFQAAHDLVQDGVVDKKTWAALTSPAQPAAAADPAADPRLQQFNYEAYPLIGELLQYGDGDDAFRKFLIGRGMDSEFVEMLFAGH